MSKPTPKTASKMQTILQQAVALHQAGHLAQAEALYLQVLTLEPKQFDSLYFLGILAAQTNNHRNAAGWFDKAAQINTGVFDVHNNLGVSLMETGQYEAAIQSFEKVLSLRPNHADTYNELGGALFQLERYDLAIQNYEKAIALDPGFAEAHNNCGNAMRALKLYEAAIRKYDTAIALNPGFAGAYNNRGVALQEMNDSAAAITSYDKAISLNPGYSEAYYNRGIALQDIRLQESAIASYEKAISLNAGYAEAFNNRGDALSALRHYEAAAESYRQAIGIKPAYAAAYNNLGNALRNLNQNQAALASYEKAIAIKSRYAEAFNNRGVVLQCLKQHRAALESYEMAIEYKRNYAEAHFNRGILLQELGRYLDAVSSYETALSINPEYEFLYGSLLHAKMHCCDWSGIDPHFSRLVEQISNGEKICPSFPALAMTSSPAALRKAAEIWTQAKCPSNLDIPSIPKRPRKKKLRIGYFSDDFKIHPVSLLTAGLFEMHDRDEFEIYAFSTGPDTKDEMRKRLEHAFDHFIDVRNNSDREVVDQARNFEIEIAVDLGGYTGEARTGIFSMRAAPIQVSYIGYLGTMGSQAYDYLVADKVLIPDASQQHYTEKIVYLPSYQVNDSGRKISQKHFSREELGLPKDGFVFCCFNNSYKITPETFDGWMRILKNVEGSVLFLYAGNALAVANLKKEAGLRGVDANRLVFSSRLPIDEHLSRYRTADLFLDTLPYNAGATAADALWAGLPVLTCTAESFSSRMAASLLTALEMPELITTTQREYEAAAIELALSPGKLAEIKNRLQNNRLTKPLFDTRQFTKTLEEAFHQMYARYQSDSPLEHLYINSASTREKHEYT